MNAAQPRYRWRKIENVIADYFAIYDEERGMDIAQTFDGCMFDANNQVVSERIGAELAQFIVEVLNVKAEAAQPISTEEGIERR